MAIKERPPTEDHRTPKKTDGGATRIDTELEQSLVRGFYALGVCVFLALAWRDGWDPHSRAAFFVALGVVAYAALWILLVWRVPGVAWRRMIAPAIDVMSLSVLVGLLGEIGVVFVPIYFSVAAGNGLRFGRHYLYPLMTLGGLGFVVATGMNPYWAAHRPSEVGLLASFSGMPPIIAHLLRRLQASRDELAAALAEAKRLATHDALTGLANASLFREHLSHALENAHRYQRKLAVLFVDLDEFKRVNDAHGHHVGDALLTEAAARLADTVRRSDLVARFAGDEFVVLLREVTDVDSAMAVAAKIVNTVGLAPYRVDGAPPCRVTVSIGIAIYPDVAVDGEVLLRRADRAMYEAKQAGRDRYACASPESEGGVALGHAS